jgi:DNA-binding CsgD family transcriptional regulator
VVDPTASPDDLRAALQAAADRQCLSLAIELRALFARRVGSRPNGRTLAPPTIAEMQCGCAVSLGLSNRKIAEAFRLAEATVKSHLHRLMGRLELGSRRELGKLMATAFAPCPLPIGTKPSDRKGGSKAPPVNRSGDNGASQRSEEATDCRHQRSGP